MPDNKIKTNDRVNPNPNKDHGQPYASQSKSKQTIYGQLMPVNPKKQIETNDHSHHMPVNPNKQIKTNPIAKTMPKIRTLSSNKYHTNISNSHTIQITFFHFNL